MQQQQVKDDAAAVTFSSAITSDEENATCGQEAPTARDNKTTTNSSKYQVADVEAQSSSSSAAAAAAATKRLHPDANTNAGSDSDSDEFHDSESDVGAKYTVVKKSVFKESKRGGGSGLLSRLKDASSLRGSSSHARNKYLPTIESDCATTVVTPQQQHPRRRRCADDAPQIVISASTSSDNEEVQEAPAPGVPAVGTYEDDGAGITVAIENAADAQADAEEATVAAAIALHQQTQEDHEAHYGDGPQVVIHSGESDSDSATGSFATLNPVISTTSSSKKYRTSTISLAPVTSSSTLSGGGCSQSASTATSATAQPCLQEIPPTTLISEGTAANSSGGTQDDAPTFLLVINALGASVLAKVEKFGTQSTFLELRVCDSQAPTADTAALSGGSAMKTALHKKSGSDAQWNQRFSAPLRSKHTQCLHIAVKTSSKVIIGEAIVSLAGIGEPGDGDGLFYDQHYAIYRPTMSSTGGAGGDEVDGSDGAASGLVHLQLKIVDAVRLPSHTTTLVPRLQLTAPVPSLSGYSDQHRAAKQPELPAALRNGALLYKVPYHTFSLGSAVVRRQWVMVTQYSATANAGLEISWCDPTTSASDRKSAHSLDLRLVTEVREGHRTKAFERQLQQLSGSASSVIQERDKCFSLVAKARTLDLVASCKEEARVWVNALRELLFSQSSYDTDLNSSARVMESYRTSALSPRSTHASEELSKPQNTSIISKAKLTAWRNTVFDLARKNRTQEIADCLHDGCPIDLLEPGDGDTVLMIACRLGHVQLVELCLSWRAKNDPHPEFGETALQAAVNSSHAECVTLLLSTAAKSDMDSEIVNHIDSNNDAPLHVAARHGDLACLQLLLHHGADICVVEEFGRTPLHCAVANGHLDCVAYLLDVGGDSVLNAGDHDGDTALHYAVLAGNEAIVKLLLESAANVFSANAQNETPYDIALREKQQQCAFLISQYYLTNTKEPRDAVASPASRNEAASTLLLRQQCKQQFEDDENDEARGHEGEQEDEELECGSDSDASTAYTTSHSPQHSVYDRPHLQSSAAPRPKFIVDHRFEDQGDQEEYGRGYDDSSSSSREHNVHHYDHHHQHAAIATSRLPLSPSAQVREALLRNQSLRRDEPSSPDVRYYNDSHPVHHRHLNTKPGSQRSIAYCSAREVPSRYIPASSSRSAFTERLDREHHYHQGHQSQDPIRSLQFQYAIQRGAVHELHPYEDDHEPYHTYRSTVGTHRHPQHVHHHASTSRNRSQSDDVCYGSTHPHGQQHQRQQADDWRRWDDALNNSMPNHYAQGTRRTNSVDLTWFQGYANTPAARIGWESESPRQQTATSSQQEQSHLQQQYQAHRTPSSPAINPLWEAFYTQDGYAYYVHRVTGVSQWEQPTAPPQAPPPPPTPAKVISQQSDSGLDTMLAPDAIIRMRLAEARRNQQSSSSLNGSTPDQSVSAPATHELAAHHENSSSPSTIPSPPEALAYDGLNTSDHSQTGHSDQLFPPPPAPEATPAVSPPASPRPESKFQERTGLQLSVDISSPTRQDETRPVFLPSPRSKSPKKGAAKDPLDSPIREFEGSFQKSRPSSPRGKSKNIQLIELKRANNLAIALASFKIHDQYEQLVGAIVAMNDKTVSAELLACLQRFFPTEDERTLLQGFDGPITKLGKAEQFFYHILQVPHMQERIDMFLYKLEFPRAHKSLLSKIQVVKRACRDLVENFSFLRVLQEFYDKQGKKSFQVFQDQRQVFKSDFLPQVDEKLRSYRNDLQKAMDVELLDLQIQFNRLVGGIRSIHVFVDKHQQHQDKATDERDLAALGVLQLFVVETRALIAELESEYESMGAWEGKLLTVFSESKASCQLATILQCVVEIL